MKKTETPNRRCLKRVVKHPEEQVYIRIYHKNSTLEGHHELGKLVSLTEFMVGVIDGCVERDAKKKPVKEPESSKPKAPTPTKQDLAWREFKETIESEKTKDA